MAAFKLLKNQAEIIDAKEVRWDQTGIPKGSKIKASDRSNIFMLLDLEVSVFYRYFNARKIEKNELKRRDQNPKTDAWVDWTGNFRPEEALLWTSPQDIHDGPLRIIFRPENGKIVKTAGLQVQTACPGKFTAVMDVYDTQGRFIREFNATGFSTIRFDEAHPENNAPFIGVSGSDISRIEISTKNVCAGGFCINQLSIDY